MPLWEKGMERIPGSGRAVGTPNRISVEARELCTQLVNDVEYQHRLRNDFRARKLHPTIESLVWQYCLGRPHQRVDVAIAASVEINARIDEERRVYAALPLADLEQLAAESQAMYDRALAATQRRLGLSPPQNDCDKAKGAELLGKEAGSDNTRYVNQPESAIGGTTNPAESESNTDDGPSEGPSIG